MLRRSVVLAAFVVATAPASTRAAPTDPDSSARERAEEHFAAGRRHVQERHCELAVPEFQASVEAQASVGAWLNLGECQEVLGHLEEAYGAFRSAQALAADLRDGRLPAARASAERIESKALRVVVGPTKSSEGVSIELDGVRVEPRRWPTLLIAPDTMHRIVARDRTGIVFTKEFSGRAGERVDIDVVRVPAATTSHVAFTSRGSTQRTAGYVTMGLGAGALVGGLVFGALTLSARSDVAGAVGAQPLCRGRYPDAVCDPSVRAELDPLVDRAETRSVVSTTLVGVGLVGVVTGIVLVALAPSGNTNLVQAIVKPKGLDVRFTW